MTITPTGTWKKPRMKVYDYNQELGSNYYQPMIEYIHTKGIQGPFFEKRPVVMHDLVNKKSDEPQPYDKPSMNFDIDNFLVQAYSRQFKELNKSSAQAKFEILRNSKHNTKLTPFPPTKMISDHYVRELNCIKNKAYPEPIYFHY